jgi:hypothetical protein
MKILFDNGTPKPISRSLTGHEVTYTRRIGWHELENGELIQNSHWPVVHLYLDKIAAAVNACRPGSYTDFCAPKTKRAEQHLQSATPL